MNRRYKYTDEEIDFVRKIAPGRYNNEIAELFNKKFGTNVTESKIKSLKSNHKIRSNVLLKRRTKPKRLLTEEQDKFLRENAKGRTTYEITDLINKEFGLDLKRSQIKTYMDNHEIKTGVNAQFRKGHEPSNKGKKYPGQINRTSFKRGQKAHNYKPVGTERIDRDGYLIIKVRDDGPWHKRWRLKHNVVWEEANGPIPEGYCLLFLDGDKTNITIENLELISRKQLARLNQNDLISNNPEITRTGLIMADIYNKIGERKRESN